MQAVDLEALNAASQPASPGGEYSLDWSSWGRVTVRDLATRCPLLEFNCWRGMVIRAGFSPDMRFLVVAYADGGMTAWLMRKSVKGECVEGRDIVDHMRRNSLVPRLDFARLKRRRRYSFSLQDFSDAQD